MDIQRQFGIRLRELRRAAGYTQAQFAACVRLSPSTISNIERGTYPPAFGRLATFARTLGVDVHYLFRFEEDNGLREKHSAPA